MRESRHWRLHNSVTNCHLAFVMLASSIVAFAVALVYAGIVVDKQQKKKKSRGR